MNLSLLVDLYELTMAQSYFVYRRDSYATFDLFVRQLPRQRAYLVAAGLSDILEYIRNLKFSQGDLQFLKRQNIFSEEFLRYLSGFRFRGDIWAMPEGEVFFSGEPLLRVTARLIEAQIIESFLLNTVNLQTMIASKAARVVSAAKGTKVYDFALRRTHGSDAGIKAARSSYIGGVEGTSCVLAGKLYGIPVVGTMAHSFVMSFKDEMESFLAYAQTFPDKTILLVDTYDTRKGIENAVKIGLYLLAGGHSLLGLRLDSGDLVRLSRLARSSLDRAGLKQAKIFASGNLDEFKIKELLAKGAAIDSFGVGTNMGTSIDAPSLDVIYKLSETTDDHGAFLPAMKLSKGKVTYPGRKQVFRIRNSQGKFTKDVIGLDKEKIKGRSLLKKVVEAGRVIYKAPKLRATREFARRNLGSFASKKLLDITGGHRYPVTLSPGLKKLTKSLSVKLKDRQ